MLCSTCGTKVQFKRGAIICKKCDSEFDMFDIDRELVPEPVFVPIRLASEYAIIDTRKQSVYAYLDTSEKVELIALLLNKNIAQAELDKQINGQR